MRKFELILQAKDIPAGSDVQRVVGAQKFILRDVLCVVDSLGNTTRIHTEAGSRFLVNTMTGDAAATSADTRLIWIATGDEVMEFFKELGYEPNND